MQLSGLLLVPTSIFVVRANLLDKIPQNVPVKQPQSGWVSKTRVGRVFCGLPWGIAGYSINPEKGCVEIPHLEIEVSKPNPYRVDILDAHFPG